MIKIGFLCNYLSADIIYLLNRLKERLNNLNNEFDYIIKAYSLVKNEKKPICPNFYFQESSSKVKYFQIKSIIPESQTITFPLRLCLNFVFQSDILVFMGTQSIPALLSVILGKLLSKPIIIVSQMMPPDYEIKRLKLIKFFKKFFLKQASWHIAQTPKTIETLVKVYGIKSERIIFAPFEAGKKFFEEAKETNSLTKKQAKKILELPNDSFVFLYIGSVIYLKGVDILIKAFLQIISTKNPFLLIVGSYNENDSYYKNLIALIEKNKIKNIRFDGYKNQIDLIKYYQASDVFVLPTRKDVFPRVLVEAATIKLPIITTNVHSVADFLVINDKNGYIVPPNDIESLKRAMEKMLTATLNDLLKMGEESYRILNEIIDSEKEENGFIEAIRRAIFKK